jgi:DNA processing protein
MLPNSWTLHQILMLTYMKVGNYNTLKEIVESTDSLTTFLEGNIKGSLLLKIQQKELFPSSEMELRNELDRQLESAHRVKAEIITLWDSKYPELLKFIPYPPIVLYVAGTLQDADKLSIGVVGTRRCTMYGKLITEQFTEQFIDSGLIITSGLAYGIDTIAHKVAIRKKSPTYAVIASGLDSMTMDSQKKIYNEIIDSGGAVICDYKFGVKALPAFFLQRNRIISGISTATIVIESAIKGGAMKTARFAFDQQRDVYAVPGNINSEKSQGTNFLIKESIAAPALSPTQVLKEIGIVDVKDDSKQVKIEFSDAEEKIIYDCLSHEPLHIDLISEQTGLDISQLLVKLLNLEFQNKVKQLPGKHYIRTL